VVTALEADAPTAAYNVCTGSPVTIRQVAAALAQKLGLELAPEIVGRFRAGDVRHCIGDPAAARQALGFQAGTGLEQGLAELLAWSAQQEEALDRVETSFAALQRLGLVR
jgi:dTDP-L-rhamnose 4-epimerase